MGSPNQALAAGPPRYRTEMKKGSGSAILAAAADSEAEPDADADFPGRAAAGAPALAGPRPGSKAVRTPYASCENMAHSGRLSRC